MSSFRTTFCCFVLAALTMHLAGITRAVAADFVVDFVGNPNGDLTVLDGSGRSRIFVRVSQDKEFWVYKDPAQNNNRVEWIARLKHRDSGQVPQYLLFLTPKSERNNSDKMNQTQTKRPIRAYRMGSVKGEYYKAPDFTHKPAPAPPDDGHARIKDVDNMNGFVNAPKANVKLGDGAPPDPHEDDQTWGQLAPGYWADSTGEMYFEQYTVWYMVITPSWGTLTEAVEFCDFTSNGYPQNWDNACPGTSDRPLVTPTP